MALDQYYNTSEDGDGQSPPDVSDDEASTWDNLASGEDPASRPSGSRAGAGTGAGYSPARSNAVIHF